MHRVMDFSDDLGEEGNRNGGGAEGFHVQRKEEDEGFRGDGSAEKTFESFKGEGELAKRHKRMKKKRQGESKFATGKPRAYCFMHRVMDFSDDVGEEGNRNGGGAEDFYVQRKEEDEGFRGDGSAEKTFESFKGEGELAKRHKRMKKKRQGESGMEDRVDIPKNQELEGLAPKHTKKKKKRQGESGIIQDNANIPKHQDFEGLVRKPIKKKKKKRQSESGIEDNADIPKHQDLEGLVRKLNKEKKKNRQSELAIEDKTDMPKNQELEEAAPEIITELKIRERARKKGTKQNRAERVRIAAVGNFEEAVRDGIAVVDNLEEVIADGTAEEVWSVHKYHKKNRKKKKKSKRNGIEIMENFDREGEDKNATAKERYNGTANIDRFDEKKKKKKADRNGIEAVKILKVDVEDKAVNERDNANFFSKKRKRKFEKEKRKEKNKKDHKRKGIGQVEVFITDNEKNDEKGKDHEKSAIASETDSKQLGCQRFSKEEIRNAVSAYNIKVYESTHTVVSAYNIQMTEDGVALDINKGAKSLPLESIVMRDDNSIISPKQKVPNQSAASLLLAPDCLSVDCCLEARGILVKKIDLNNIGVSEAGAVDTDMGINAVKTETSFNSTNSMQLPVNEEVNCNVKDDSFLAYKRRKGDLSNKQLGLMEKGCILRPNSCRMDLETCSRTGRYVQTSGKLDATQIIKSEENGLKDDHVTLAGDTLTLQACISSSDINLVTREKSPIQVKISDSCIGVDSRQNSAFQNIEKCDGARCKQVSPTSKVESTDKKVDICQVDDQPNIGNACAIVDKINTSKQKIKKFGKAHSDIKDEIDSAGLASKMNGSKPKRIPVFESFAVEEEEGSGGYGTVYKARRKHDGKIFAIKCPLENTPTNYVTNELKMLERFGGKHCIIKYEGVVKDHDCDCLILQYVEHEKPEVLKREIDVSHLCWYGYCMFKALQALHKEGIIHRDVKPGNFLFSRKLKKGYLIDFNLAMDQLDPNPRKTAKPRMLSRSHKNVAASAVQKPPVFSRREILENFRLKALLGAADATNISKKPRHAYIKPSSIAVNLKREEKTAQARPHDSGNNRVHSNPPPDSMDINHKIKLGEQAAVKMSGMHLLMSPSKDITSAQTPSGGNKREPLPSQGRKELLNLLYEAQHSPQREAPLVLASQRKRVAAMQERVKRDSSKIIHVSPMPSHPNFNTTTAGYNGLPKNKDQKFKRDGPCVGTRGYRAPEVLLRSLHQGCKVDIWSAGVTLLYFMIGKAPFQGTSTEQAIKEIVKLCGKEEIWEMAKIHDRESSLPVDLYAAAFESMPIEEWCRKNTKRPEFLESIPPSLFDLVNKCLCVNPRQRIDADEALEHEFFAPSREALKRARSSSREFILTELSVQHPTILVDLDAKA